MQFVDGELIARREMEVVALPVEAWVVHDGVADRVGHFAGIRIDALEFALCRSQQVTVLIADMSFGNVGIPMAVLLGMHGMLGALPIVEATDDRHSLGMRRPHAKANSARMGNG